ncbi:MAG: C40 family peptidase [Bacteroidales bacterium]|nr:C40 family peptidase [Bacteroidales bacterium]
MTFTTARNTFARLLVFTVMAVAAFAMNAQRLANPNETHRGTIEEQMANAAINYKNQKVDALIKLAFTFRGTPYVRGASRPGAFDCSGFTSYVFRQFGYNLDRTSRDQVNNGRKVTRNELKPGDLVFFNGRARGNRIGHVGIVTEADNGAGTFKFIHAASKGVRESHSSESYYQVRYVGACRVIE